MPHLIRSTAGGYLPSLAWSLRCSSADQLAVGIAESLTLLGLGGAGVAALWRIAFVTGRFEGKITSTLQAVQQWLENHESRIRHLEGDR